MEPNQRIKKYVYTKLISSNRADKPIINKIIQLFNNDIDSYSIYRIKDNYEHLFINFFYKGVFWYKLDYTINKNTYRIKKYNDATEPNNNKKNEHKQAIITLQKMAVFNSL